VPGEKIVKQRLVAYTTDDDFTTLLKSIRKPKNIYAILFHIKHNIHLTPEVEIMKHDICSDDKSLRWCAMIHLPSTQILGMNALTSTKRTAVATFFT